MLCVHTFHRVTDKVRVTSIKIIRGQKKESTQIGRKKTDTRVNRKFTGCYTLKIKQ